MVSARHRDLGRDDGHRVGAPFEIIPGHPEEAIGFVARLQLLSQVLVGCPLITWGMLMLRRLRERKHVYVHV